MSKEIERNFPSEMIEVGNMEEERGSSAFLLAKAIMEDFEPSFIIIGSPFLKTNDKGYIFPEDIGIVLNDKLGITKTTLSVILFEVAYRLGEDMAKIETFLRESFQNDND